MAPMHVATTGFLLLLVLVNLAQPILCSRNTAVFGDLLTYHNGEVLQGDIAVSIMWYGAFTPAQKTIVSDFFLSLAQPQITGPSVNEWWSTINQVYLAKAGKNVKSATVLLAGQVSDESCSLGKSLKAAQIAQLAAKTGAKKGGIAVVLTAQDVSVEGFCMNRCGLHGADAKTRSVYVWAGNSATQCPGMCAWPFHQPVYGPQAAPLVAPNGDVGIDGMVMNLATLVAGAVTNPFGDGFYQGPKEAPMEAASACPGVYGKGAYPGYAGDLLVDSTTGASYNANGVHGRKYLVPALFDPSTSKCYTLV